MRFRLVFFIWIFVTIASFAGDAEAKNCRKGIPCGRTCIAAWKTCHIGGHSPSTIETVSAKENEAESQPKQEVTAVNDSVAEKGVYQFSSLGENHFITESPSKKTLKCKIDYCSAMSLLKRGTRLRFLDNGNLVEYESSIGSHSCEVMGCKEIVRD